MATKKHNFTRTEISAGLMVLASVAVLVGFIVVVEQLRAEPEYKTLYARFTTTTGLSDNALVRFGGLEVGRVADVRYDPENQSLILVEAHVNPDTPVNESSLATVESVGLTAEKHLEISTGTQEAILLADGSDMKVVNSGYGFIDLPDVDGLVGGSEQLIADLRDFLGVEVAKKAEAAGESEMASIERIASDVRAFLGVKEALDRAAAGGEEAVNINKLAEDLRKLLGVEAAIETEVAGGKEFASVARVTGDVRDLLGVEEAKREAIASGVEPANVENVLHDVDGMLERYDPQIGTILDKVPPLQDSVTRTLTGVADTLDVNRVHIDRIIEDVSGITTTINTDLDTMLKELTAALEEVKGLSGSAGELVQFNRPAIEDLLGDLGRTIQNLNVLLEDLKSQPQSVIFGKPETGRK